MKTEYPADINPLYREALEADDAYHVELVRVYGAHKAGDARYKPHTDAACIKAKDRKLAADVAWRAVMAHEREHNSRLTHSYRLGALLQSVRNAIITLDSTRPAAQQEALAELRNAVLREDESDVRAKASL